MPVPEPRCRCRSRWCPEPLVSVPEPLVPVPEPLVSVPEPLVPVPDPLSPGAVLSWPLLVVLVLSVGFVVVPRRPVGRASRCPAAWSVGSVVVPVGACVPVVVRGQRSSRSSTVPSRSRWSWSSPELVVWVEPSVGQVVPCVCGAGGRAERAAGGAGGGGVRGVEAVAGGDANALGRVRARRLVGRSGVVRRRAGARSGVTVWEALTVCDGAGATCELKLIAAGPDRGDVRAEAGRCVDDASVRGCRVRVSPVRAAAAVCARDAKDCRTGRAHQRDGAQPLAALDDPVSAPCHCRSRLHSGSPGSGPSIYSVLSGGYSPS